MHMYCTYCTCIFCWAWPWAWDWAPLSRNCCGQCCCNLPLTATMYCSHNNTLVKIPNPGNGRYTDHLSVNRPRWQPWVSAITGMNRAYSHKIKIDYVIMSKSTVGNIVPMADGIARQVWSARQGCHRGRYTDKWSVNRPFPGFGIFTKVLLWEQ